MSAFLAAAADGAETTNTLPYPAWAFGGGILVLLLVALYVVTRLDPDR